MRAQASWLLVGGVEERSRNENDERRAAGGLGWRRLRKARADEGSARGNGGGVEATAGEAGGRRARRPRRTTRQREGARSA